MQNTTAAKLMYIKLPMYLFVYLALGFNDFDGGKSVTRPLEGVGPEILDFFRPAPYKQQGH
jgi:hypothetical protein